VLRREAELSELVDGRVDGEVVAGREQGRSHQKRDARAWNIYTCRVGSRFQICVGLVWAWGAAVGCTGVPAAFSCTSDAQCDVAGSRGRCEPTGACSFVDSACASGWRYDPSAAAALARQCVGDLPDLGATDGTPDGGGLVAGGPSRCDALGPVDGVIACTGFEGTANAVSLFQVKRIDDLRHRPVLPRHLLGAPAVMSGTTQSKFAQPQYKNLPTSPSMYAVRAFVFFRAPGRARRDSSASSSPAPRRSGRTTS